MPNPEDWVRAIGVRVQQIEKDHAENVANTAEIKSQIRDLTRHYDENRDALDRLAENHTKTLRSFESTLSQQRDLFQTALERQRAEHKEALEQQEIRWRNVQDAAEQRWRAAQEATELRWQEAHRRVMEEVIVSIQGAVARAVLGKAFQWVVAGLVSLAALAGGWLWAKMLR